MKKAIASIFLLILLSVTARGQQLVTWEMLADIKWVPAYVPALGDYYDYPRFSKAIKKLNKKQITIQGFYVPVDVSGKLFALSAQPAKMCFFCTGAGPETVMEVIPKDGGKNLKNVKADKFIQIKGKLKLNTNDINHLMYILEEAELVKELKTKS